MISVGGPYQKAVRYLDSLVDYEKTGGFLTSGGEENLEGFCGWLEQFGQPQKIFPSVLIGGTKGKGSTAAILASIARASGLKVGLYTSPHLESCRERIRINGRDISGSDFARIILRLRGKPGNQTGEPRSFSGAPMTDRSSVFELLTAAAFIRFAERGVDLAVLEVGLGGRLDATNVADPLISVITPISLDHTQVLGNTIGEIAREKGGIIRPGGTAVIGPQPPEAEEILEAICAERRSRLIRSSEEITFEREGRPGRRRLSLFGRRVTVRSVRFQLVGRHQAENAATALAIVEQLRKMGMGMGMDGKAVQRGLETVKWPGRFEVIHGEPTVVLDGAHNVDSFEKLTQTLAEEFPGRPVVYVMALARDKDLAGCLGVLAPTVSVLVATEFPSPRARPAEEIAREAAGRMTRIVIQEDPKKAMASAIRMSRRRGIVCVTGSLYLIGALRRQVVASRSRE